VRWLKQRGVRWEFARSAVEARDAGSGRLSLQLGAAVRTLGKGDHLVTALFSHAESVGVQVFYGTGVTGLLREGGRVVGVRCGREGVAFEVRAAAVVLGGGGFESDPARRMQYLGPLWERTKVRGTRFNTGELLDAALAVGAAPSGDWQDCHATPVGADSPDYGDLARGANTNRLSYTWGIQVNLDGERFGDEGEDHKLFTYAKMGKLIHRQRDGLAFQLYDAEAIGLLEERYDTSVPIVGDSVEQVAESMARRYGEPGFNSTRFVETVKAYNAATPSGTFDPTILDGLSTEGLVIEKTNWARPIVRPPFMVYPVTAGITFTYGGLRINRDAAVLDGEGSVIPGLFATGEITGDFFYGNYPAGAGLMRGSVFGRIAGERAAATVELPIA
jgi:tricarballylate dehydrogenase